MGMGAEMLMEAMIDAEIEGWFRRQQYLEDLDLVERGIWRMKDGGLIQIAKMSSQHLRNTIAMIERKESLIEDDYLDLFLEAKEKMKAELSRRYPPVDRTEGFFDDMEVDIFEESLL